MLKLLGASVCLLPLAGMDAAVLYDSQGFETPPFTVGEVGGAGGGTGQNGWTRVTSTNPLDVQIVESGGLGDSQALFLRSNPTQSSPVDHPTRGTMMQAKKTQTFTVDHFVDFWILTPPTADISSNLVLRARGSAGTILTIGFNSSSGLSVTPIGSSFSSVGYSYTPNAWNRLTVGINMEGENDTFTIYLNGEATEAGMNAAFGTNFANITSWEFEWRSTNTPTGDGVYVDNFMIYDMNPIPEPAGAALLGLGAGMLLFFRRKK